jgi:membrane protein
MRPRRYRIAIRTRSARAREDLLAFAGRVVSSFRANQGFLLAGAVAYYTLLSIVPLLILLLIALSHFIDEAQLVMTVTHYLDMVIPGQTEAVMDELAAFLKHRGVIGWVLMITLVFFSSLAFTVLENAMSVIFHHRVAIRRRHFLTSALLPYCYIMFLGVGLLVVTVMAGALQAIGSETISISGHTWSLHGVSGLLLYLLGVAGEILVLTSIYLVMPVGRLSLRTALVGGVTATLLWEIMRRLLVWFFSTLSQVRIVYGSLTTAIVALLSLEIAAMVLLLGAQVIAELERGHRRRVAARLGSRTR